MAHLITIKDQKVHVGDIVTIDYTLKDGEKTRTQEFRGTLTKIKGGSAQTRMITIRKMSKSGIGVERIIPVHSPYITAVKIDKKSTFTKAKMNFLPGMSEQTIRIRYYRTKK